jgi:hypothetical protein
MANEHELIEKTLASLAKASQSVDRQYELLSDELSINSKDLNGLLSISNEIDTIKENFENLIISILSKDYDGEELKKSLLKMRLMHSLKREGEAAGSFEIFVRDHLSD